MFVDRASINRWAIRFLPLLEKVFRKHKRPVGGSWRMDETCILVKGAWKYHQVTNSLVGTLLKSISRCVLPKRPGRIEPRAKKRRPKPLPLLTVPRSVAREQIKAQRA